MNDEERKFSLAFGQLIRKKRLGKAISFNQFCAWMGITKPTLWAYENGLVKIPLVMAVKIMRRLDIKMTELNKL